MRLRSALTALTAALARASEHSSRRMTRVERDAFDADIREMERDALARLDDDPAAVARGMTDAQLLEEISARDKMAAVLEREWMEPRSSVWSTHVRPAFLAELAARGIDLAQLASTAVR